MGRGSWLCLSSLTAADAHFVRILLASSWSSPSDHYYATGCLKKNFPLWKLGMANITADNEKSTVIFLDKYRWFILQFICSSSGWVTYQTIAKEVISIQHQAWKTTRQFETNSSHVPTHLLDVREGLGILLVFAKAQYGFLTASSIIYHDQFSLKESTLFYMVTIMRSS